MFHDVLSGNIVRELIFQRKRRSRLVIKLLIGKAVGQILVLLRAA